jgi:hypothetical protein
LLEERTLEAKPFWLSNKYLQPGVSANKILKPLTAIRNYTQACANGISDGYFSFLIAKYEKTFWTFSVADLR